MKSEHRRQLASYVAAMSLFAIFIYVIAFAPKRGGGDEQVVADVFEKGLLKDDGILIFEHSKDKSFDSHPNFCENRSNTALVVSRTSLGAM